MGDGEKKMWRKRRECQQLGRLFLEYLRPLTYHPNRFLDFSPALFFGSWFDAGSFYEPESSTFRRRSLRIAPPESRSSQRARHRPIRGLTLD